MLLMVTMPPERWDGCAPPRSLAAVTATRVRVEGRDDGGLMVALIGRATPARLPAAAMARECKRASTPAMMGTRWIQTRCLNTCQVASCGDGVVHQGQESCDDGNRVDTDAESVVKATDSISLGAGRLGLAKKCAKLV